MGVDHEGVAMPDLLRGREMLRPGFGQDEQDLQDGSAGKISGQHPVRSERPGLPCGSVPS